MPADDIVDLARLLPVAVEVAFRAKSFPELQAWLNRELDAFLPKSSPARGDVHFARAFSVAFGRALWNGMPRTAAGNAPPPVREPGRNEPCLCGSQKKYKQCCLRVATMPVLPPAVLWPYVLAELPRAERKVLAAEGRIPIDAIGEYSVAALEDGRPQDAIDVLEPWLAKPEHHHDYEVASLMNLLCDAYDARGFTPRRKIDFLESLTRRAPRSPLRSEAWQRLATIYMDQHRHEDAWQAVRSAQRDDPSASALPLLEVHLLVAERRLDEARQRADFWIRTLQRAGEGNSPDDRRIEFLDRIRKNPLVALGEVAIDAEGGAARGLAEWLARHADQAVPAYSLERVKLARPAPDAERNAHEGRACYGLAAPAHLAAAERAWHAAFPLGKPFSIQEQPFEPDDVWAPEVEARWMRVLEAHDELFGSLDVLDDLATAVLRHPQAGMHGLDHLLYEPLLERSAAILARTLEAQPSALLPWSCMENRPALRSLVRRYVLCMDRDDQSGARRQAEQLLQINPDDNHGMRFMLINEYLRCGQDDAALALAKKYPTDMAPETRFGLVLALFRMKRLAEAEQALRSARRDLPKIVPYLLPARIARPPLNSTGVVIGGDDQAWMYRDAMRAVWQATEGALEWLKKMARLK